MNEQDMTYEQAMEQLEQIAQQMETGNLGIDQMAEKLKTAQRLAAYCKGRLQRVDEEIKGILSSQE